MKPLMIFHTRKILLYGVIVLFVFSLCPVWADYSLPTVDDSDKAKISHNFGFSYYHNTCATEFGEDSQRKAHLKQDYINNIKKVAVLGFDINLWYQIGNGTPAIRLSTETHEENKDSHYGLADDDIKDLTNSLYDLFLRAMDSEGFQVIPVKKITGSESYQSLSYEEIRKSALRKGIPFTASGLKRIETAQLFNTNGIQSVPKRREMIEGNINKFMSVVDEAGADTGVIVSLGLILSWKGDRFGNLTSEYKIDLQGFPNSPGMTVDFFIKNPPRIAWSACLDNYDIPSKHQAEFKRTPYFMGPTIWYNMKLLQPEIETEMFKIFAAVGYQLKSNM